VSGAVRDLAGLEAARARWTEAVEAGRLEEALELVEGALPWAEAQPDLRLAARVRCNRARIAIELGHPGSWAGELRDVLMAHADAETAYLAAYSLARCYELKREARKARFYAQIARDHAEGLDAERLGSSLNQLANVLVAESRFEEAAALYRQALDQGVSERLSRRSVILYNLGYCETVLGHRAEGFRHLYAALRALVRQGARRHEMLARLDLAFALLEAGRARPARRHAERGLDLAREFGAADAEKNALYLAGAAAVAAGDRFGARRFYERLQAGFYPDNEYLPDLLLQVDVRGLVNLKA
jgi:tetratricopeptide (TPR) repeat protein